MSRVAAAYLACALIWGTTWFAIRVCIGVGGYPTYDALALRFAIASAILVPIALRCRPWPRGRAWTYLVVAGVLDAGGYLLVYVGEQRVPGGVAAVLYGTQPLILALLLSATRMERITQRHVLGALVSLVGVSLLFRNRLEVSPEQAVGVGLVLASVVVSTTYTLIMKQHGDDVHAVVSTAIFLGVTALVLAAVAFVAHQPIPWPPPAAPTVALVYLAVIGSVVAFLAYFWLLARTTVLLTSTLVFVFPLVALVTDRLFETDASVQLDALGYAGVAITLAGLAVSVRRIAPALPVSDPAPR